MRHTFLKALVVKANIYCFNRYKLKPCPNLHCHWTESAHLVRIVIRFFVTAVWILSKKTYITVIFDNSWWQKWWNSNGFDDTNIETSFAVITPVVINISRVKKCKFLSLGLQIIQASHNRPLLPCCDCFILYRLVSDQILLWHVSTLLYN